MQGIMNVCIHCMISVILESEPNIVSNWTVLTDLSYIILCRDNLILVHVDRSLQGCTQHDISWYCILAFALTILTLITIIMFISRNLPQLYLQLNVGIFQATWKHYSVLTSVHWELFCYHTHRSVLLSVTSWPTGTSWNLECKYRIVSKHAVAITVQQPAAAHVYTLESH